MSTLMSVNRLMYRKHELTRVVVVEVVVVVTVVVMVAVTVVVVVDVLVAAAAADLVAEVRPTLLF